MHCRTSDPLIINPCLHEKNANSPSLEVVIWPWEGTFKDGHDSVSINT